jgi:hypothetical protein
MLIKSAIFADPMITFFFGKLSMIFLVAPFQHYWAPLAFGV